MRKFFSLVAAALLAMLGGRVASADPVPVVLTQGTQTFKTNRLFSSNLRYVHGNVTVNSGDSVRFEDTSGIPHSITIVDSQLATDWVGSYICLAANLGGPCAAIAVDGHGFGAVPVLEAGAAGLDTAGDSLWLFPNSSLEATISAPPGSTLHYACSLHPWMQGTIKVK
ncbi:MAG: hypothetical protein HYZ50_27110 [Deltaproteobacteria bacterium]|nr:hypothetical protein [Deltaproteobacteria bacterium]